MNVLLIRRTLWLAWGTVQAFVAILNLGTAARDAVIAHYWYAVLHLFTGFCCALWCREICYAHLMPLRRRAWVTPVDAERIEPPS